MGLARLPHLLANGFGGCYTLLHHLIGPQASCDRETRALPLASLRLFMEQSYWLRRKRISAANARRATHAQARLVHLDLAGRYSIKAAAAAAAPSGQVPLHVMPPPPASELADAAYYERLETGARWLALQAPSEAERHEHLGIANKYARLRAEAPPGGER